ncbi:rod shape-determining protein MreC [Oscillospiraceae bacterium OttesenSCG-928-G22]|nr:rod shape-determining protein MreC [Oscillospiraceae bacterium OttesenSCG-928-G22]
MKSFFRNKLGLFLVLALLIIIIMALVSAAMDGQASPVTNAVQVLLSPFKGAAASVGNFFDDIFARADELDALREENAELRAKVADMEALIRDAEKTLDENERLRTLHNLSEKRRDLTLTMAAIVSKEFGGWESTLTINKGEHDGIEPYDCVIDEEGHVVGYISKVGTNWAIISVLFDTDVEMGAILSRTREPAVAEGDFALMTDGLLKLSYLPEGTAILNGDLVLTSGVGGVYPSELVIGSVARIETSPSGLGNYAVIEPAVDFERITQVFVVTDFDIVD